MRVKGHQIVHLLAHSDKFDRNFECVGYCDDNAALGRAIELRYDHARHARDLAELLGLNEAVLPGRAVEHEKDLLAGVGKLTVNDARDLAKLVH